MHIKECKVVITSSLHSFPCAALLVKSRVAAFRLKFFLKYLERDYLPDTSVLFNQGKKGYF